MNSARKAAVAGNVLMVLWIIYNAIDEGFRASNVQKASSVGLVLLLGLNTALLIGKTKRG